MGIRIPRTAKKGPTRAKKAGLPPGTLVYPGEKKVESVRLGVKR